MNDPTFLEASRVLAAKLLTDADSPGETIPEIFLRIIGRNPAPAESALLKRLLDEQLEHFGEHPLLAEQILAIGEAPAPETHASETAALAMVINTLMNYDEFVMKQ